MKKNIFMRIGFILLAAVLLVAAFSLPQEPELRRPTLCEQLFREVGKLRQASYDEAVSTHSKVFVGTVTEIERRDKEYMPIYIMNARLNSGGYVAVEQWAVDHVLYKVTVDETLANSSNDEYESIIFSVPFTFHELESYSEDSAQYSGYSFAYADRNAELPKLGDELTITMDGQRHLNDYTGSVTSQVYWNEQPLTIGRITSTTAGLSDYRLRSYIEKSFRTRAVPPIPEGETYMEAVTLAWLNEQIYISDEEATANSPLIFEGTVTGIEPSTYTNGQIYLGDYSSSSNILEDWETKELYVSIAVDKILKSEEDDAPYTASTVYVLESVYYIADDRTIETPGVTPKVGDRVTVWVHNSNYHYRVKCGDDYYFTTQGHVFYPRMAAEL